jgi:ribosomal protein L12E/L44/L45/RPP1/RPP2
MRIIDKDGCLTIRTRSGLYRFNVLPLGISPAVSEFQRAIEMLLGEELMTSKVRVYLDDIIIFSNSLQEHSDTLDKVLTKLEAAGLKLKREKCKFAVKELKFLGYVLSTEGVSLDKERIQALIQALFGC